MKNHRRSNSDALLAIKRRKEMHQHLSRIYKRSKILQKVHQYDTRSQNGLEPRKPGGLAANSPSKHPNHKKKKFSVIMSKDTNTWLRKRYKNTASNEYIYKPMEMKRRIALRTIFENFDDDGNNKMELDEFIDGFVKTYISRWEYKKTVRNPGMSSRRSSKASPRRKPSMRKGSQKRLDSPHTLQLPLQSIEEMVVQESQYKVSKNEGKGAAVDKMAGTQFRSSRLANRTPMNNSRVKLNKGPVVVPQKVINKDGVGRGKDNTSSGSVNQSRSPSSKKAVRRNLKKLYKEVMEESSRLPSPPTSTVLQKALSHHNLTPSPVKEAAQEAKIQQFSKLEKEQWERDKEWIVSGKNLDRIADFLRVRFRKFYHKITPRDYLTLPEFIKISMNEKANKFFRKIMKELGELLFNLDVKTMRKIPRSFEMMVNYMGYLSQRNLKMQEYERLKTLDDSEAWQKLVELNHLSPNMFNEEEVKEEYYNQFSDNVKKEMRMRGGGGSKASPSKSRLAQVDQGEVFGGVFTEVEKRGKFDFGADLGENKVLEQVDEDDDYQGDLSAISGGTYSSKFVKSHNLKFGSIGALDDSGWVAREAVKRAKRAAGAGMHNGGTMASLVKNRFQSTRNLRVSQRRKETSPGTNKPSTTKNKRRAVIRLHKDLSEEELSNSNGDGGQDYEQGEDGVVQKNELKTPNQAQNLDKKADFSRLGAAFGVSNGGGGAGGGGALRIEDLSKTEDNYSISPFIQNLKKQGGIEHHQTDYRHLRSTSLQNVHKQKRSNLSQLTKMFKQHTSGQNQPQVGIKAQKMPKNRPEIVNRPKIRSPTFKLPSLNLDNLDVEMNKICGMMNLKTPFRAIIDQEMNPLNPKLQKRKKLLELKIDKMIDKTKSDCIGVEFNVRQFKRERVRVKKRRQISKSISKEFLENYLSSPLGMDSNKLMPRRGRRRGHLGRYLHSKSRAKGKTFLTIARASNGTTMTSLGNRDALTLVKLLERKAKEYDFAGYGSTATGSQFFGMST